VGRDVAFSAVVVLSLGLILWARALPVTHATSGQGLRQLGSALRDRAQLAGIWLVVLPAMVGGALNVLGPLRLHVFGAGAGAVGATFLGAAVAEGTVTPWIGRFSDRHGRIIPLRSGLAVTVAFLVCFTLPGTAVLLAVLIVAMVGSLGGFWAPAMAIMSDAADHQRLDQALAAALMNMAWAVGALVGEVGSGAIAKAAGDGLPMFLLAGLCGATLGVLLRRPVR
jgi:MFS family permease